MAITRWRPFRDVVSVQDEMNRLFDDIFGHGPARVQWTDGVWNPSVDVSEDKDNVVVRAEMPGLNKDDVKISVQDNVLTLKGEKKQEKEEKESDYHRIERSYGSFCRSFQLPTAVEADKIKASYRDGVLNITLPKTEEVKPKEIPISID
ncbi:MAG: Hsp20/alpha crystallin family protein [Candidatus Zixiibacteriota bacterium]|nr:MAG: Hsp20/alpha crystallin family protein [candidate division Zixibacteria bacterium]